MESFYSKKSTFTEFSECDLEPSTAPINVGIRKHGYDSSENIGHPSFEDVGQTNFDLDAKYRSMGATMTAGFPQEIKFTSAAETSYIPSSGKASYEVEISGPPKLTKGLKAYSKPQFEPPASDDCFAAVEFENVPSDTIYVPEKPYHITPLHFLTTTSVLNVIAAVELRLNRNFEISYQFVKCKCMWDAVYLRGSSYCKFQIHVYKDAGTTLIIELNRLSGDGFPFRSFYNELKADFNFEKEDYNHRINSGGSDSFTLGSGISSSLPNVTLSDEEASACIKPILAMAKSDKMDAKFEASAILCDFSLQEEMQQLLCDQGCVNVLMDLLKMTEFQNYNYHVVCALANLSSSQACQEVLVGCSEFLSSLLKLAIDGPYHNAVLRRESARVLANICHRHSSVVLAAIDCDCMHAWMESVDSIKDERLHTWALRAKTCLSSCNPQVY